MPRLSGLLAATLMAAAIATVAPRTAHAENITGIDPQPLAQALDTWARQTGLQVIYCSELMKGRTSRGAPAGLNPRAALTHILNGSGLAVTWLNERTASIHANKTAGETSQASLAHLAQADSEP